MSKWSQELQDTTRDNLFPGAVVKDEDHNYGFVMTISPRIVINGIQPGGVMPLPSEEVIATFDTVNQMVNAGWVLD